MAVGSTFRRYVRILKIGAYKQKIKNNKLLNVDASNNFEIMDPLSVEQIKKSDLNVEISLLLDTKMCDPTLLMLQQPILLATVSPVFCFGNYDILEIIFF